MINVDDEYKTIQNYKQKLIDDNILGKNAGEKFDSIADKWNQTKDKKIVYKNVDTKVNTKNYLNKRINYNGIDMIERSIKNGIRIYQKRPPTDKNKSDKY